MEDAIDACDARSLSEKAKLARSPSNDFDPLNWSANDWVNYGKEYILPSSTVAIALFALVVLTLLVFLLWRCINCFWCGTPPHAKDPHHNLTSNWAKVEKAFVVVFGILAIAAAVVGMVLIDKAPVTEIRVEANVALNYADMVVRKLDSLLDGAQAVLRPLDEVQDILEDEVSVAALTSDLQCTQALIDNLPSPNDVKTQVLGLDAAVNPYLRNQIKSVHLAAVDTVPRLYQAIVDMMGTSALLEDIEGSLKNYSNALNALPPSWAFEYAGTERAVLQLAKVQKEIEEKLLAWDEAFMNLSNAMQVYDEVHKTNKLFSVAQMARILNSQALLIGRDLLPPLLIAISRLDALCFSMRDGCVQRASFTMNYINTSIVQLPSSITDGWTPLQDAQSGAQGLCSMGDEDKVSLDELSQHLNELQTQLVSTQLNIAINKAEEAGERIRNGPSVDVMQPYVELGRSTLVSFSDQVRALGDALDSMVGSSYTRGLSPMYVALERQARGVSDDAAMDMITYAGYVWSQTWAPNLQELSDVMEDADTQVAAVLDDLDEMERQLSPAPVGMYPADVQSYVNAIDRVSILDTLPWPRSQVLNKPIQEIKNLDLNAMEAIASVRRSVTDAVDSFQGNVLDELHEHVDEARRIEVDYLGTAENYYSDYGWRAWLGVYAGFIALVLLIILFALLNCPGALVTFVLLTLCFLVFYMIVPVGLLGGQLVVQDGCAHAETIAIEEAARDDTAKEMVNFYLYGEGSLSKMLLDADIVDVYQTRKALDDAKGMISNITGGWAYGPRLTPVIADLEYLVDKVADLLESVLEVADFLPVHNKYLSLKASVCCDTDEYTFTQYMCMTVSGMLCWALAVASFFIVWRLDKMPKLATCGCMIYRADDFWIPPGSDYSSAPSYFGHLNYPPQMTAGHAEEPPAAMVIDMPPSQAGAGACAAAACAPAPTWGTAKADQAGDSNAPGPSTGGSTSLGSDGVGSSSGGGVGDGVDTPNSQQEGSGSGVGAAGRPDVGARAWTDAEAPAGVAATGALALSSHEAERQQEAVVVESSCSTLQAAPSHPLLPHYESLVLARSSGGEQGAGISAPRRTGSEPKLGTLCHRGQIQGGSFG